MFKLPQISALDLPSVNFPTGHFPSGNFPSVDFSRLDVGALRNAGYLIVGAGVVAVERAQARLAANKTRVETRVEIMVDRIESALPGQAGLVVGQARDITRVAREQVRGLIRSAA